LILARLLANFLNFPRAWEGGKGGRSENRFKNKGYTGRIRKMEK
jgi:hypothetical protein